MEDSMNDMTDEKALLILEGTQYLEDSDCELPEESSSESNERTSLGCIKQEREAGEVCSNYPVLDTHPAEPSEVVYSNPEAAFPENEGTIPNNTASLYPQERSTCTVKEETENESAMSLNHAPFIVKEESIDINESWLDGLKEEPTSPPTCTQSKDAEKVDDHCVDVKVSHSTNIHSHGMNCLLNNDMENPEHPSPPDIARELPNASSSSEGQQFLCPVCGKASRSLFLSIEHKKSHEKVLFKCHSCGKFFFTKSTLKRHTQIHVSAKQRPSDSCEFQYMVDKSTQLLKMKSFKSKYGDNRVIQNSRKVKHELRTQRIVDVSMPRARTKEDYLHKSEKQTADQNKAFQCDSCKKFFARKEHLIVHVCSHAGDRPFTCNVCDKRFCHSGNLKVHFRIHCDERPFVCSFCGKGFKESGSMKRHIRTHTGERPFKCNICGKAFSEKNTLKHHTFVHSGETPFVCSFCGKGFKESGTMKRHLRTHTGERPFKCNICGKAFSHSNTLKQHTFIHSGERPFVCSFCGKGLKDRSSLTKHIRVHTGERPFKCSVCCKEFSRRQHLRHHSSIHTNEGPLVCSLCGKGFKGANALRYHIRLHTGEKLFECNVCGKSFARGNTLKMHTLTHSGARPYICKVCCKAFTQKGHLNTHSYIHTGLRPYCCDMCKQSFITKASLRNHIEKKHT